MAVYSWTYLSMSPWHNWIARRPPEPKVRGSNPLGDTRLTTIFFGLSENFVREVMSK